MILPNYFNVAMTTGDNSFHTIMNVLWPTSIENRQPCKKNNHVQIETCVSIYLFISYNNVFVNSTVA
jgi:hypothetical protein